MRLPPQVIETELGLERQCIHCAEWWPLDGEFYYRNPNGHRGFEGICRACKSERHGRVRVGMTRSQVDDRRIREMLALGRNPQDIADLVGVCLNTVLRRRRAA
jgi:hypothetical protein